jgi:hypothetical protein
MVRNQGNCGSCWAFAAVGTVEAQQKIVSVDPTANLDLSEEILVSGCAADIGSCCGGLHNLALEYIRDHGIPDEGCFPYRDVYCSCEGGMCVAEGAAAGASAKTSKEITSALKHFRDRSVRRKYVELYYRYSSQLMDLLAGEPALKVTATRLLVKYWPTIETMVDGEGDVVLSSEQISEIITFINSVKSALAHREPPNEISPFELVAFLDRLSLELPSFADVSFSQAYKRSIYYRDESVGADSLANTSEGRQCQCQCSYNSNNDCITCSNSACSDRCADWSARVTRIVETNQVAGAEIKAKIIEIGPISAAMAMGDEVGGSFDNQQIYRCGDDSTINHAVVIVGYDDERGTWIVRNSWGEEWEENGYFHVGYGECAIENSGYLYSARGIAGGAGVPNSPMDVAASKCYTDEVLVSWAAPSSGPTPTGYKIFRATTNNPSSAILLGTATASPYHDTTASAGTIYYYWVKAYNSVGDSAFSLGDSGVRDTSPPTITDTPVMSWAVNRAIAIAATITDNVGVQGATLYYRATGAGRYAAVAMTASGSTYTATIPGSAVTTAGLQYYLEARDAANNVAWAPSSALSTPYSVVVGTTVFTDDPLTARSTLIKALHFTELRTAINTLRARYGLPAFGWSTVAPTSGGTVLKAHLTDLRTALDQAYAAAGKTHAAYAEPTITAATTLIKASHLNELRTFIRALE